MSCAEVLIGHVDDGGDEEDGDGDYHLVSQRATCCFAESGSAFVNWELKVPENVYYVDADAGWRKRCNNGWQRWEKRISLASVLWLAVLYLAVPLCDVLDASILQSVSHSLLVLVHPLFLCFVNPPELECTQYWVTSHHPSSVKAKKAINSVSCSSSILCISQAAFLGIESCYLRQLIKLLQRDSYKSFMQVASTTGSRLKELVKGQPIAFWASNGH